MKNSGDKSDYEQLHDELRQLQKENVWLKSLLKEHGIPFNVRDPISENACETKEEDLQPLTLQQKVQLFRDLFRGRNDVFPTRWESANGKSGYSPACGNEWRRGICQKPRVKCSECPHRKLLPLTDQVVFNHLAGRHIIGVYPLCKNDTCYFLVIDFDDAEWRDDAQAFMETCRSLTIPASFEISRSGNGAHIWIFFADAIPARDARQLGAALISRTCERTRQLSMSSYDRLFPSQDTVPKGGFGNLIALPLQKPARDKGFSVFVDDTLQPYPDQWSYLASVKRLAKGDVDHDVESLTGGRHPLDVAFITEEDELEPWKRSVSVSECIQGPLPTSLTLVLANQIFIEKEKLSQPLLNRCIRLAAFQNPEFYKAQAMRLPVWDKPRIIGCAENFPKHIGLPRGCFEALQRLLKQNFIETNVVDERLSGSTINVVFNGTLRADQVKAVRAMVQHDEGILCAPTAFGKTVVASAIIARRKKSTLILVHRTELMRQWQERLHTFLDFGDVVFGSIGGGKKKLSGQIDIGLIQSLSRQSDLGELLDRYGQIIIDECHHLSAFTFESILKEAKSKFILGFTATPIRRDGHQPILFLRCGPVRYRAMHSEGAPVHLEVLPLSRYVSGIPEEGGIQEIFRALITDEERNRLIVEDIKRAYDHGRKVLVLTERTEHLELLVSDLGDDIDNFFVLHGRIPRKNRLATLARLQELPDSEPRIILATGRLIGEGFDHPPLDTLVLAMPISWKGTLQQYAGRLHREHTAKGDVRIYDYVEQNHSQLARMREKRLRGYRAMGYKVSMRT